tara:strand:- start:478 stop:861 length:384 start_codon:yes stop_codon:yes gene_type:complete
LINGIESGNSVVKLTKSKLKEMIREELLELKYSSDEAKHIIDLTVRQYAKDLRKTQFKIIKDLLSKAKSGIIDYFDIITGLKYGDVTRAYPYELKFLLDVLTKTKVRDRFRSYTKSGRLRDLPKRRY